jgi:hypothetical protein
MRGGSPAAETDHAWAAAAPISPLCKVAGPPMINSTGNRTAGRGAVIWPLAGPLSSPGMAYWMVAYFVFCIFIHRHPWGECPLLPRSALVPRSEHVDVREPVASDAHRRKQQSGLWRRPLPVRRSPSRSAVR